MSFLMKLQADNMRLMSERNGIRNERNEACDKLAIAEAQIHIICEENKTLSEKLSLVEGTPMESYATLLAELGALKRTSGIEREEAQANLADSIRNADMHSANCEAVRDELAKVTTERAELAATAGCTRYDLSRKLASITSKERDRLLKKVKTLRHATQKPITLNLHDISEMTFTESEADKPYHSPFAPQFFQTPHGVEYNFTAGDNKGGE